MRRALVAGHVCVDLIPELGALPRSDPGELEQIGPLAMSAGGCVSNTGGALAELDVPVQVVGDAGDDELGRTLVRLLESRGLGSDRIRLLPERSTSYTIVVQTPERDRSFWHHVGANAGFDGAAVDVHDADLLHVGYPPLLPALVADGGAQLDALLVRARTVGLTTSLDLAVLDPRSPAAGEHWPALLRRVLPHVDVITPSLDDLRTTLDPAIQGGPDELGRCARRLVDMGAAIAMVTGGSAGAHLCTADPARLDAAGALFAGSGAFRDRWSDRDQAVAPPEVPVRSTVGAGDAATAGLLYGLLTAEDPDRTLELAMRAAGRRLAGVAITTDAPPGREISWRP